MKRSSLALLAALFIPDVHAADAPRKPNVIIVLSDDQGYGDFSCHGNPILKTPNQRGFHETVYHLGWGITSMADLWQNDYFDGRFRHNGELKQYKGYCTDVWFDLALAWMKGQKGKAEPFFVYLPTNAPHGPLWV